MSIRTVGVIGGVAVGVLLVAAFIVGVTFDLESDSERYTKEFVQRAIDRYGSEGRETTIAYHNSPESVDREWYVFIIDENETMIAHPTRKDRIGTTREDRVDVTGYYYGEEFASATEDGKWVSYSFTNPTTGQNGKKHTWIVRHDGLLFGSGWYEN